MYLVFPRAREEHLRRFVWWMICLLLLAGAITIAALIGGKYSQLVLSSGCWLLAARNSQLEAELSVTFYDSKSDRVGAVVTVALCRAELKTVLL